MPPGFRRMGSDGRAAARDRRDERHVAGGVDVRDLNRPRRCVEPCQGRPRRAARAGLPQECQAASVGRPGRQRIAERRGRDEPDRLSLGEQPDEAVIVPVRHERQRPSVGRPGGRLARPARVEQLLGRLRPVDRCDPDLLVPHERDPRAVGRGRRFIAVADQARRAARDRHRPDLNLRLDRVPGRIGRCLRLAVRSVIAATHVDQRRAVAGERQLRQLLPVILTVRREAPWLERWAVARRRRCARRVR